MVASAADGGAIRDAVASTEFPVGAGSHLTALARHELGGRLDQTDRTHIGRSPRLCRADRPLSLVFTGQSVERETVAGTLRILLRPLSTEAGVGWPDSDCCNDLPFRPRHVLRSTR
jgi:hypothetical protein